MPRTDERAVSDTISYITGIGVFVIFLGTALAIAYPPLMGAGELSTEEDLEEIGQQVAGQISNVDRLVRSSASSGTVGQTISVPSSVGSDGYSMTIYNGSDSADGRSIACGEPAVSDTNVGCIVLAVDGGDARTTVAFRTETQVNSTRIVSPNELYIVREDGETHIEIQERG
jgi:hypothetical protein